MKQRDLMRRLFREFNQDELRIVSAYANAEQRGEVLRKQNSRNMPAEEYASRLFREGIIRGWIRELSRRDSEDLHDASPRFA